MKYKIDILSNLWYTDIIMIMNKVGLGISMRRRMGGLPEAHAVKKFEHIRYYHPASDA